MAITIQVDSRENKNEHVLNQLKELGCNFVNSKLYVGDYTLLHKQDICIDRKASLLELANNICNSDNHQAFKNELMRAKESNIKLYILIEDEYIYNLDGVKYFKCPTYKSTQYKTVDGARVLAHKKGDKRSQVNFETLGKAMKTMEEKYGCEFLFAKKKDFGKKILWLLGVNF